MKYNNLKSDFFVALKNYAYYWNSTVSYFKVCLKREVHRSGIKKVGLYNSNFAKEIISALSFIPVVDVTSFVLHNSCSCYPSVLFYSTDNSG